MYGITNTSPYSAKDPAGLTQCYTEFCYPKKGKRKQRKKTKQAKEKDSGECYQRFQLYRFIAQSSALLSDLESQVIITNSFALI